MADQDGIVSTLEVVDKSAAGFASAARNADAFAQALARINLALTDNATTMAKVFDDRVRDMSKKTSTHISDDFSQTARVLRDFATGRPLDAFAVMLEGAAKKAEDFSKRHNNSMTSAMAGIAGVGAKIGALAVGVGLEEVFRRSYLEGALLDRQLSQLSISLGTTAQQTQAIKNELQAVQSVAPYALHELVGGFKEFAEQSRASNETVVKLFPTIAQGAYASQSSVETFASAFGTVYRNLKLTEEEAPRAIDMIVSGMEHGHLNAQQLENVLPRLTAAFSAMGYSGRQGLAQMTAVLEEAVKVSDSTEAAAMATERIVTGGPGILAQIFPQVPAEQWERAFTVVKSQGGDAFDFLIKEIREADRLGINLEYRVGYRMAAVLRQLVNNWENVRKERERLENVEGTAYENSKKYHSDLQHSVESLEKSWDRVKNAITVALASIHVPEALNKIAQLIDKLSGAEAAAKQSEAEQAARAGATTEGGEKIPLPIPRPPSAPYRYKWIDKYHEQLEREGGAKPRSELDHPLTNDVLKELKHHTSLLERELQMLDPHGGARLWNASLGPSGGGGGYNGGPNLPGSGGPGDRATGFGGGSRGGGGGGGPMGDLGGEPDFGQQAGPLHGEGADYLAEKRAGFGAELKNPGTRELLGAIISAENPGAGPAVAESLMNRTELVNEDRKARGLPPLSLRDMITGHPSIGGGKSFYGPMRSGAIRGHLARMRNDPRYAARMNKYIDQALAGSDLTRGHTDQGSAGDPNYTRGGVGVNINRERFNDWGYRGSRAWRQRRQRAMAEHAKSRSYGGVNADEEQRSQPLNRSPARRRGVDNTGLTGVSWTSDFDIDHGVYNEDQNAYDKGTIFNFLQQQDAVRTQRKESFDSETGMQIDRANPEKFRIMREQMEKPIRIRFERDPGQNQFIRSTMRRNIEREMREARWTATSDIGAA